MRPLGGPRPRERLGDLLLRARPDAGVAAQLLRLGRRLQPGDGRDAELLPDPPRRLRAEAGQAHERRDLRRHLRLPLRQRVDLAVLDDLDDLRLDRLADSLQLLRLARRARAGRRTTASRGSARPPCGRRRCERGRLPRAPSGRRAARTAPRARSFRGSSAMVAIIGAAMRATVCLPTYNERENLEPMLARPAGRAARRRPRARDRRQLAGRHRASSPTASPRSSPFVSRPPPRAQGGARPRLPRRLPPRARRRRRARPRDGLRLLARPGGRAAADRRRRGGRRRRARLALRPRRPRSATGG